MLVLSRHRNEAILIGGRLIKIIVVDIRGDKVRLGIEAPDDISVHREEVFDEIQRRAEYNAVKNKSESSDSAIFSEGVPSNKERG